MSGNNMKGYKQTEVGLIPEDWEFLTIKELIAKGIIEKPLDGNHGNIHPKSSDYVDDGIPFIMANDIKNGYIDINRCHFIKKEQADNLQKGFALNGDVLLTHKGTVGNVSIVHSIITDYIMLTPQVTYYRVKNSSKISNRYIKHFFESNIFQSVLLNVSGGGTRAYIGIVNQQNLPFVLPEFAEQTAIATALSDADALITSLEKLIEKKRAIKQGAMQDLLKPKEGWEVKKLGECLLKNPDYGINAAAVDYNDTLPTYLRITDISNDGKYLSSNKVSVNNILADFFYLEVGDIVFTRTGASVGKSYKYDIHDGRLVFAGFLIRVKPNPAIVDSTYLFFLTQTKSYWTWVLTNSMRSGQPGLNSNEYKSWEIHIPNRSEQTHIATILSDMDAEITALEQKLAKYKQIKQGMMQELLTGRIRLIDAQ